MHINIHEAPWKAMNDFIRRSAEKPTNPHPFAAAVQMRGGGLVHDERLAIHDLSSVKQRFAQLTTFKCHPTAKSAYQRQDLHKNEDVCRGAVFLSFSIPVPLNGILPPTPSSFFSQEENVNVDISGVEILLLLINLCRAGATLSTA